MSRKNNLRQFQSITNGAMSANITSPVTCTQWLDNIGIQFNWTGSSVSGNFQVQVSADYARDPNGSVTNAGNWAPLTLTYLVGSSFVSSQNVPTTVGSPIYLDLNQLSTPWIRVVFTTSNGSSDGILNAYITAKEI